MFAVDFILSTQWNDTSTNWRQSLSCCCTASMEQATDGAETATIDGLVSSWSENIFVSFCLRAPRYRLTLWCALGLLVGGAIQEPQLQLQCDTILNIKCMILNCRQMLVSLPCDLDRNWWRNNMKTAVIKCGVKGQWCVKVALMSVCYRVRTCSCCSCLLCVSVCYRVRTCSCCSCLLCVSVCYRVRTCSCCSCLLCLCLCVIESVHVPAAVVSCVCVCVL